MCACHFDMFVWLFSFILMESAEGPEYSLGLNYALEALLLYYLGPVLVPVGVLIQTRHSLYHQF